MPAKAKKFNPLELLKDQAGSQVETLWEEHQKIFAAAIDEAENKKIKLNFQCAIDLSEADPVMTVTLSFKDKTQEAGMDVVKTFKSHAARLVLDNPNAPRLPLNDRSAE